MDRVEFDILDWMDGTQELSLEEKGFYLELILMTYLYEAHPVVSERRLSANFNISTRKFQSLLQKLSRVGKIGFISASVQQNPGSESAECLQRIVCNGTSRRLQEFDEFIRRRSSSGKTGGIKSGEVRRNKVLGEARASRGASTTPSKGCFKQPRTSNANANVKTRASLASALEGATAKHEEGGNGTRDVQPSKGRLAAYTASPMAAPTEATLVRRGIKTLDGVDPKLRPAVERELAKDKPPE